MIDHLTLKVRDIRTSIDFYRKALAPLGYVAKAHHEPTIGFGAEDDGAHSDFYLTSSGDGTGSPVTHIAFRAADAAMVDAFYQAALAHGGTDNGAPGERPYHPGYYAAFVLDPDGNNIEAVFHGDAQRSAASVKITF